MIVVSTEQIPGRDVAEALGMVRGNAVRARNIGRDILALFRNIIGGELKGYTQLQMESRGQATDRMVAEAEALGADAVVTVRYTTSMITGGASEIMAFGTAVKLK
ncbi:YbjQ family protein [bacterium]|nr:YbjQ family protein [bacterium]